MGKGQEHLKVAPLLQLAYSDHSLRSLGWKIFKVQFAGSTADTLS